MLKFLATIDWNKCEKNLFITLTYNDDVKIETRKQLSNHLWMFLRQTEKDLGRKAYGVWRIEWKIRKTGRHKGLFYPHYHLMLLDTPYLASGKVNHAWKKALGQDKYVRTEVQAMANVKQAGAYVAKYCAKVDEDCSLVNAAYLYRPAGREWGMFRKGMIPLCVKQETRIGPGALEDVVRNLAATGQPHVTQERTSFTVLGDLALTIARIVFCKAALDTMDNQP